MGLCPGGNGDRRERGTAVDLTGDVVLFQQDPKTFDRITKEEI
jgi:hypothetical protein